MNIVFSSITLLLMITAVMILLWQQWHKTTPLAHLDTLIRDLNQELWQKLLQQMADNQVKQQQNLSQFYSDVNNQQMMALKMLQDTLRTHLEHIGTKVEQRLSTSFNQTTQTFSEVVKRLALIDQAQQKITELSSNVVSLQDILQDKHARGAFGEIQLASLVRNIMPPKSFALQYTLKNGKRADCVLFLPPPMGNIVIDAKFPLENFKKMTNLAHDPRQRKEFERQFKQDIKKHIQDIACKYIVPEETSNGAVMFIPAESVLAQIHNHYPELDAIAREHKVWIVSPTTIMMVINTAQAILKDATTRQHVHIIQQHLHQLAKDFARFEKRMENLAKHISQAHQDVEDVNKSTKKITSRFNKIDQVALEKDQSTKPLEQ